MNKKKRHENVKTLTVGSVTNCVDLILENFV